MHARLVEVVAACVANDVVNIFFFLWLPGSVCCWCLLLTMKGILLFTLVYFLHCKGAVVVTSEEYPVVNDRPMIGVLSQEQSPYLRLKYSQENYTSYIAASYVKNVEAAGARVVPILIGKSREYYRELMSKLNGVFFPGGATYLNQSDGYADAGQHIYEIAMEMNDAGEYFPLFGTCLGFELFIILASGRGPEEIRVKCYSFSNLHLDFPNDFRTSKMYREAPDDVLDILAHENVTVNLHQYCIVDETLKGYNLTNDWKATSYSTEHGFQFIASLEHKRYPFYGVQFHPEKVAFEWKKSKRLPHTIEAVKANRYFMDFFVKECRRSTHSFASQAQEDEYVIYNYEPKFTGVLGSAFQQCYFFEPRGSVPK